MHARSPFVLDTHELGRRPGAMREVRQNVVAPAGLGTAVVGVAEGSPVELDLRLESVMDGVLVSGTVHAFATGECVRCLDSVERQLDVSVQELFEYPGTRERLTSQAEEELNDEDVVYELDGDLIDIEPVLRDTVVPALPFQPMCREDCPGLCAQCGARLEEDPDHHHESVDPRWAALKTVFDDTKES